MKKVIALILTLALSVALLAGCGSSKSSETKPTANENQQQTQTETKNTEVKSGLGHVISTASSSDATADKAGVGQVDTIMAAVTVDGNGKILSVKIDNAQVKVNFDATGKITSDKSAAPKTKVELGKDYGLIKASKIGKEWYEQIAELEKWMVGKTIDEVKAMKVKKVDDSHTSVPDVEDLKSKVTISVADYIAAVEEAVKTAQPVSQTVAKSGLGHVISTASSTDATADKAGVAQVDTIMAAATFDADGKILSVKIDNAQVKVNFDATGKITSDKSAASKTKVELGKDYGMIKASKIGKEWYEQIAELEKWMVGKTVDEVKAMKVKKVDDSHTSVPDVEDLKSKVTISVADYIAAVEEAYNNAK